MAEFIDILQDYNDLRSSITCAMYEYIHTIEYIDSIETFMNTVPSTFMPDLVSMILDKNVINEVKCLIDRKLINSLDHSVTWKYIYAHQYAPQYINMEIVALLINNDNKLNVESILATITKLSIIEPHENWDLIKEALNTF